MMMITREEFWEWMHTMPSLLIYEILQDECDIVSIRFHFSEEDAEEDEDDWDDGTETYHRRGSDGC